MALLNEFLIRVSFRSISSTKKTTLSVASSMKIKTKECWKINRGEGYAPIMSCEGIGDDHYFYVTPVWWLSGLLMSGVFLYGAHVSESLLGGCISGILDLSVIYLVF